MRFSSPPASRQNCFYYKGELTKGKTTGSGVRKSPSRGSLNNAIMERNKWQWHAIWEFPTIKILLFASHFLNSITAKCLIIVVCMYVNKVSKKLSSWN